MRIQTTLPSESIPTPQPKPLGLALKLHALLALSGAVFSHALLLAIRIVWGWQFFQTGKGKLGSLDNVTSFFTDLNIPLPRLNAVVASSTECFGGLCLLLGLGARLVSVPLGITMVVAYLTAHRADIHSVDDFVKAAPFPFLFTALVVFSFGPGLVSLDAAIKWFVSGHHKHDERLPLSALAPAR